MAKLTVGNSTPVPVVAAGSVASYPRGVTLFAPAANTGTVVFGPANVTYDAGAPATDGDPIPAGGSVYLDRAAVEDIGGALSVIASAAGQAVYTFSGRVVVSGGGGGGGTTTVSGEVEVKNDSGNPIPSAPQASAAGGATTAHLASSAAGNNATSVKGSAGTLYGVEVFNASAATVYLKLYDKAGDPSPASDTPVKVIPIPATAGGVLGGVVRSYPVGVAFSQGIGYALVTGAADSNNSAVGAGDVVGLNLDYK